MKKLCKSLIALALVFAMILPTMSTFGATNVPYKKTGTVYTINGKSYYQAKTTSEYNGVAKGSEFWIDTNSNVVTKEDTLKKLSQISIFNVDGYDDLLVNAASSAKQATEHYYNAFVAIANEEELGTIIGKVSGTALNLCAGNTLSFSEVAIDVAGEALSVEKIKTTALIGILKVHANNADANLKKLDNLTNKTITDYDSLVSAYTAYAECSASLAAIVFLAGDEITEYKNDTVWDRIGNYLFNVLDGLADSVIPDIEAVNIASDLATGALSAIPLTELALSTKSDSVYSAKKDEIYNSFMQISPNSFETAKKLASSSSNASSTYSTGTYKPTYSEGLNIRSTASTSGTVVGAIKQTTSFTVTKISGNWGYTTSGGKSGWVCLDYATKVINTDDNSSSTNSKYSTGTYKPTYSEGLNIRSTASTSGSIVGAIKQTTSFTVTKISGNWGYTTSGGKSGWVCLDYATKIVNTDNNSTTITRDDGIWLFPVDKKYYQMFNDWCACPGNDKCVLCNSYHKDWSDNVHSGQKGHNGIDLNTPSGTPVYAAASGTYYTGGSNSHSRGYYVVIEHTIGNNLSYYSGYQHLSKFNTNLKSGATVKAGDLIGYSGSSGEGSGTHLHFGIVIGESGKGLSGLDTYESWGSSNPWATTPEDTQGRILNNPADNLPTKTVLCSLDALKAHKGSVRYTFDKSEVNIGSANNVVEEPVEVPELPGNVVITVLQNETFSSTQEVIITWESAVNASKYGLTVVNDSTNKIVVDGDFTGNSKNLGVLPTGKYRYQMRAYNSEGKSGNLTAKYYFTVSPAKYTVTYNTNGGTSVASQTKTHGIPLTLSSVKPTKPDHLFLGWSTTSNGNVEYGAGSDFDIDKNTTLYAIWQKEENEVYYIVYNANGGQNAPLMQTKNKDEDIAISDVIPTREGYIFKGWATESNGVVEYNANDTYKGNKTLYLHAVWEAKSYKISYNAAGGKNAPSNQNKIHDKLLVLSDVIPVKDGFVFVNWFDGSDVYNPGTLFEKNADTTLTAIWEEEEQEEFPFIDVPENAWYKEDVLNAYNKGIVNGKGENRYAPEDNMTYAEAIKIACTIYQLYYDGEVTLKNGSDVWYSTFMEFATETGIIRSDYSAVANKKITRKDFVNIFYAALPAKEFKKINTIDDNAIPDVKIGDAYSGEIYTFYRAGILTGSDSKGSFMPDSNIKRNEVSAIVTRMLDHGARKSITLN